MLHIVHLKFKFWKQKFTLFFRGECKLPKKHVSLLEGLGMCQNSRKIGYVVLCMASKSEILSQSSKIVVEPNRPNRHNLLRSF